MPVACSATVWSKQAHGGPAHPPLGHVAFRLRKGLFVPWWLHYREPGKGYDVNDARETTTENEQKNDRRPPLCPPSAYIKTAKILYCPLYSFYHSTLTPLRLDNTTHITNMGLFGSSDPAVQQEKLINKGASTRSCLTCWPLACVVLLKRLRLISRGQRRGEEPQERHQGGHET